MTGLRTYFGVGQTQQADPHILEGALGGLVLRPWFDWVAVRSIANAYFPLSRAWAAAQEAEGSVPRFLDLAATKPIPDQAVRWMLNLEERRRARYEIAASRWEDALFTSKSPVAEALGTVEAARRAAAHDHMATRAAFVPLLGRLRPVRWQIATPLTVEARHGRRLDDPAVAFPVAEMPSIETSHDIRSSIGTDCWLRFDSPILDDKAWARVSSPVDVADPPTLIFLHGIGVEADMWKDAADPLNKGVLDGFRIVRPEAPWHSRRRRRGWYGGEPAIGMGPLGFLDLFQAWITEISVLIDWARRTSGGPVALGGVSLGALISQVAAVAAREWPAEVRPDALFLVATSGAIMEVVAGGSLSKAVNLQPQLDAAGWSQSLLARWLPLLEPQGPPAMPADKVVMVLGESDDLTPHPGGVALARDWAVPSENLFVRPQGHFSVSLGLLRDREPLNRLAKIMCVA